MSLHPARPAGSATIERSVDIRRLVTADVIAYRNLMLEAYDVHPDAFTSSAAERAALPLSWWERRLQSHAAANEIVIGRTDVARSRVPGVALLNLHGAFDA